MFASGRSSTLPSASRPQSWPVFPELLDSPLPMLVSPRHCWPWFLPGSQPGQDSFAATSGAQPIGAADAHGLKLKLELAYCSPKSHHC